RVGHFHSGQFADHRLEFEDGLQRALGNFRLVGGVGGEKFAARNQRIDNDGPVMKVRPRTQKAGVTVTVFTGALAEIVDDFRLGHLARDIEIAGQAVLGGNRSKQLVDGAQTDRLQHGFAVGGRLGEIAHASLLDVAKGTFDCDRSAGVESAGQYYFPASSATNFS